MKKIALVLLIAAAARLEISAQSLRATSSCPASQAVHGSAPPDPNVDSSRTAASIGDWYINSDRTIWAGPIPTGGWPSGGALSSGGGGAVKGQKTYWVRPAGQPLVITGRRIDGPAPALEANIPCCYSTGFQIVALFFPTEGCWEVSAAAGDRELVFVTQVKYSSP
jgi:hypothetical protein